MIFVSAGSAIAADPDLQPYAMTGSALLSVGRIAGGGGEPRRPPESPLAAAINGAAVRAEGGAIRTIG